MQEEKNDLKKEFLSKKEKELKDVENWQPVCVIKKSMFRREHRDYDKPLFDKISLGVNHGPNQPPSRNNSSVTAGMKTEGSEGRPLDLMDPAELTVSLSSCVCYFSE